MDVFQSCEMTNQNRSDLRATLAGKDLPEDVKQRLLAMHEENVTLKESVRTTQEKYVKARQFIKNQDKLFKEQYSSGSANLPVTSNYIYHSPILTLRQAGTFEEAEASFRSQIKVLEEDLARQRVVGFFYFD
jgi:protein HOOK3